ncbi:MAG: hypothetical protein ABEK29_00005, partial [Bradymonadaceae bacterium]
MDTWNGKRFAVAAVFLLFAAWFGAAGCGSDPPKACSANADCRGSRVCRAGRCQFGLADTGTADSTDTADTVRVELCGLAPDACDPWEEPGPSRCSCRPLSCSSGETCNGYACVDGTCTRCKSDTECGEEKFCGKGGKCVSDKPCMEDRDCSARKKCKEGKCVERDDCVLDEDCEGEQEVCLNGRCTHSSTCEADSDCREGMECIGGQCYEEVCRGSEDCAGDKFCDAGECVKPPSADRCFVATSDSTISKNERVPLEAFALDEDGNGVAARFTWSASKPQVAAVSDDGQHAVGGTASGVSIFTARLPNGTQCDGAARLTNLGTVREDQLRVVVSDAQTGNTISGANVAVHGEGTTTTDSNGVATFPEPNGTYTVTVMSAAYNYLTVKGIRASDIRLRLIEKQGEGPTGGFSGKFDKSKIHTSGDVTLGLAGTSVTGGVLEAGLDELLGRPFVRQVQTPDGMSDFPLPAGMVAYGKIAGLDLDIKKTYYATSPGGAHHGWGLVGEVPGSRLFEIFQGGTENPLATLLPLFNRFDHGERPLNLSEYPRTQDSSDIDGDGDSSEMIPDYKRFPPVDLQPSVRQNLVTEVSVSNFPSLPGGDAEFAVLTGGNMHRSSGWTPLGISATSDDDDDGFPDDQKLFMAPPHGSITGGRYTIMAMSFRTQGFSPTGGFALPDNVSAALWSKQTLPKKVGLGTFPDATDTTLDTGKRTIDLTADAGPLYRFQFRGKKRTWEVWTAGPMGSMGTYRYSATIPNMPVNSRTDLFVNAQKRLVDAIQAAGGHVIVVAD